MSLPQRLAKLPKKDPAFMEPMKCRLIEKLPVGKEWGYEIKFDGFRGMAVKKRKSVALISRNHRDLGKNFPEILAALAQLPAEQIVLDGEIVALDENGRSSFQLLQGSGTQPNQGRLFYYLFDILNLNGRDTTGLSLAERKKLLKEVVPSDHECLRVSDLLPGTGSELEASMRHLGLEGLIAKKHGSLYEPGQRSGAWLKYKWGWEQEFIIGGYTDPEGSRPFFGSLLVGYYQDEQLIFAGKVGTGFSSDRLKNLHGRFQKILQDKCSFSNIPERGSGLTAAQMRSCTWVAPKLVCQVRFTEWTRDGHLRQPVFLGLREDKNPREVVRENPDQPPPVR